MKYWEIEKGLKLCSLGAKEKTTKCRQCPYLEKGCLSALLADSLRYIKQLKIPKNGDIARSSERGSHTPNPEKQGSPAPCRNGKPVSEWLKEERERREKNGEKDCGDIPW